MNLSLRIMIHPSFMYMVENHFQRVYLLEYLLLEKMFGEQFSNSLIIHAALTQPEHLILVR